MSRFFSRKRNDETSAERGKSKGKTPEPHSPERSKPVGLTLSPGQATLSVSSSMLSRNPTIKVSQVEFILKIYA